MKRVRTNRRKDRAIFRKSVNPGKRVNNNPPIARGGIRW